MKTKGLYIATAYITTFLRYQESKAFQYNDKVIYYEPMKKVLVLLAVIGIITFAFPQALNKRQLAII